MLAVFVVSNTRVQPNCRSLRQLMWDLLKVTPKFSSGFDGRFTDLLASIARLFWTFTGTSGITNGI
jgi:hypothetical protein